VLAASVTFVSSHEGSLRLLRLGWCWSCGSQVSGLKSAYERRRMSKRLRNDASHRGPRWQRRSLLRSMPRSRAMAVACEAIRRQVMMVRRSAAAHSTRRKSSSSSSSESARLRPRAGAEERSGALELALEVAVELWLLGLSGLAVPELVLLLSLPLGWMVRMRRRTAWWRCSSLGVSDSSGTRLNEMAVSGGLHDGVSKQSHDDHAAQVHDGHEA